jgi:hypothetical protein
LLTQTSIGPSFSSISSAAFSTASESATSSGTMSARPPAASSRSGARAISAIEALSSANRRTTARPTPADAPVTTTTLTSFDAMRPVFPRQAPGNDGSTSG